MSLGEYKLFIQSYSTSMLTLIFFNDGVIKHLIFQNFKFLRFFLFLKKIQTAIFLIGIPFLLYINYKVSYKMDYFSVKVDVINSQFKRVVSQLLFIEKYGYSPHIFVKIQHLGLKVKQGALI